MKKFSKTSKLIAVGVCIAVLMTFTGLINAGETETTLNDGSKIRVESETDLQKVVVTTSPQGVETKIKYNKQENSLNIVQTEKKVFGLAPDTVLKEETIKLTIPKSESITESYRGTLGKIIASKTESWSNYAYRVRHLNPANRWWVRTNQGQKVRYANTKNIFNLRGFMASVDTMALNQADLYALCGGTLTATIGGVVAGMAVSGILTPFAIFAAAVIAVGGSITGAQSAYKVGEAAKKARYYYALV